MATHSSTLAWKIPWTEEPGRLQSMGSLRSDMTERLHFHFSLSCIGEGNGNPLQCSCLENPGDGGAWWAAVYGVAQSRTWLKRLSSSSTSSSIGFRDKAEQASDLASNLPGHTLTVSALTACCGCKPCSTIDKIRDKSWNCWAPGRTLVNQAPGLTTFQVLHDKTNSISMKPELQFAHN